MPSGVYKHMIDLIFYSLSFILDHLIIVGFILAGTAVMVIWVVCLRKAAPDVWAKLPRPEIHWQRAPKETPKKKEAIGMAKRKAKVTDNDKTNDTRNVV